MSGVLPGDPTVIGLLAEYAEADDLLRAAARLAASGYRDLDACTPIHVEGLDEILGLRPSRLGLWIFGAGAIGAISAFAVQTYATGVGYPMNVGGRPLFSWPAYLAITFEFAVLIAALMGFFGMLGFNGLPALYHPFFNVEAFERASRDRFFLYVAASDPLYTPDTARHALDRTEPIAVHEVTP